jgi:tripartite-type tricarboxylate transporter receptor subunit TctC
MQIRFAGIAIAGILQLSALEAAAQYPVKPIRSVVPFAAGGAADIAARTIAQGLSEAIGQPVIVENRPGADGAIAGEFVAKSAPDGYTLLWGTNSGMLMVPLMRKNPPYQTVADFTPVSFVGKFSFFLVVHAGLPANSVTQLIDYARANPGILNYGTTNSTAIAATAQLMTRGKFDMVHIPYKGEAQAIGDFLNGRFQVMFMGTPSVFAPHAKEGKLRVLATLLDARSPMLPDVPTMVEAGMPPLDIVPWMALFGPAKLPKDIADRLSRGMVATLKRAEIREQLSSRNGFEANGSTPESMDSFLKAQIEVWGKAVRDAGMKPE